jgi:ketosteroid isomerase-like protein
MAYRILFILLFAGVFSTTITAQSKQQKAVAAAVEALRKAMVDGDRAALENIAMDGLSYGHSGGKVEDKATFIENIANGNSDFVTIDLTDQTIYVSGKTAIVRHRLTATTNDKGKGPATVNLAIMTVWQKDKKEWKMLARQAVKVQ